MTTLFLIRHGLTAVTGKTLYGRTPGVPLDDRGCAQAEALAERFAPVRPDGRVLESRSNAACRPWRRSPRASTSRSCRATA